MLAGLDDSSPAVDPRAQQLSAMLAFGRRANTQPELSTLMQDAISLVAEILDAELSGVGMVTNGGTKLVQTIAATDPQGRPIDAEEHHLPLGAENSTTGYALSIDKTIVTSDMDFETRFADPFLHKLHIKSALTLPLYLNNVPFGTLGVYSRKAHTFTSDDIDFAETMSHMVVSSIARIRAEEALREQNVFASTVMELVDSLVVVLDVHGNVLEMNNAAQHATGTEIKAVRGKPFCKTFVPEGEIDSFRGALRDAIQNRRPVDITCWSITDSGTKRQISWILKVVCNKHGEVQSIVLSGVDCTEQPANEKKLALTKTSAEDSDRTLEELHVAFQPVDSETDVQQRSSPRRNYRYRQLIAPRYDSLMPAKQDFFEVMCEDISAGGVSFYMDKLPDFESIIVALGTPPEVTYFSARTVRIVGKTYEGREAWLVGCRFSGRVHL